MAENLDALKCGGWGVFIASTTKMTVGASDNGATRQSGGAPDRSCSLSGAPSDACSDSTRAVGTVHCSL
jgi:hypothetical protein